MILGQRLLTHLLFRFQYEHISALAEFVDAQASYYRQATEIMDNLHKALLEK